MRPGGGAAIPGAASSLVCNYHTASENVIIEVLANINPSLISQFSAHFLGTVKPVSGVGDQATSFYDPLNNGKDNEGVVATKGSTLVSIDATATPGVAESGRGAGQLTPVGTSRTSRARGSPAPSELLTVGSRRSTALSALATGGSPVTSHVTAPHATPSAAPTITSLT